MEEDNLGKRIGPWPSFVFRDGPTLEKLTLPYIFENRNNQEPHVFSVSELQNKVVYNCCYGWLILSLRLPYGFQFSLWNFVSRKYIDTIPDLTYAGNVNACSVNDCILTLPPSNLDSKLLVFDYNGNIIWFYCLHRGKKKWMRHSYRMMIASINLNGVESYRDDHLYTPVVTSEGNIYALTYRRQVLVKIKVSEKYQPKYSCRLCLQPLIRLPFPAEQVRLQEMFLNQRQISRNLVESCGEIFSISVGFGDRDAMVRFGNETIDVEILKLNEYEKRWERVSCVRDRAFFCSDINAFSCSTLCSSIKENCIYFGRNGDSHLYLYDIEENTVSVTLPCSDIQTPINSPIWLMPNIRSTDSHSQVLIIKGKEEQYRDSLAGDLEMEENDLSSKNLLDFPFHLLNCISEKLNYFAYKNFTNSSRMCREVTPLLKLNQFSDPWLLSLNKNKGVFNIIGPKPSDRHLIQVPETLRDATICQCQYGWLLMSKYIDSYQISLYFVNPFTKNVITYPDLESKYLCSSRFGFSSPPTSPSCLVIVVAFTNDTDNPRDRIRLKTCHSGEKRWIEREIHRNTFRPSRRFGNPIYVNDAFFFLSEYGELAILRLAGDVFDWRILEETKRNYINSFQGFLAEFKGEIYSFFINDEGIWVTFKFDRSTLCWSRITGLEKCTMYASRLSSTLIEADDPYMEDKVIFSRFWEKDIVSLCLKSAKLYSSGGTNSLKNLYGTAEQLQSCWIQPT